MAAGKSVDSTLTKTATASSLFDVTIPHSGRRVGFPVARRHVHQSTSRPLRKAPEPSFSPRSGRPAHFDHGWLAAHENFTGSAASDVSLGISLTTLAAAALECRYADHKLFTGIKGRTTESC